jgi:hypothetical protein
LPSSHTSVYSLFLICEVKTNLRGLGEADWQNTHSASIAVRAFFEPYKAAYEENHASLKGLYGKILVFTISHNHKNVAMYGHYARPTDNSRDNLEYYRYGL